jgi:hypothetical protein
VYLWVDPRSDQPFYVGKGQQQRALSHLQAGGENRKTRVFAELRDQLLVLEALEELLKFGSADRISDSAGSAIEAFSDLFGSPAYQQQPGD